ncbi:RNA deprotection pyrophosphohydrolase [Neobacillus sp. SM06]|uniref:RNA deprotection pyrophosphohydrolase n=1 Tax=Neobacillus sp. SM06 TaxID=3422492 RepID=UPI003D2CC3EC
MEKFIDHTGNEVELSFEHNQFHQEARHVLVITETDAGWLLTNHKMRGLEFPGGKAEKGETLEAAARREVYEETGGVIGELKWVAEYRVNDPESPFVKAVFLGKVKTIDAKNDYLETRGPVIVKEDILKLRDRDEYSFIMKDKVIEECVKRINQIKE